MLWNRRHTICCLLGAALLTGGCAEKTNWKEQAVAALSKHEEIKNYTFTGSADVDLSPAPTTSNNPMVQNLQQSLQQGQLSWEGKATLDPLQVEANFTLGDAASGLTLPVLITDQSMYINIPLINRPQEYFHIDFAELSELTGSESALSEERLKQTAHLLAKLHHELYDSIEEQWFSQLDNENSDSESAQKIGIMITEENQDELSEAIRTHWPAIVDTLQSHGLVDQDKVMEWRQKGEQFALQAPGELSVVIDEEGYAGTQIMNLTYIGEDGSPQTIRLEQSYGEINEDANFQIATPEQVLPINQVLRLFFPSLKQE